MQEIGWKARLASCSSMAMPIVISSHNGNTADASASTAASSSISRVKNVLPTPEKTKSSRKRKTKLRSTLPRTKIWKKPEIKKCFSPTMTKRTISSQSNFTGTRTEERLVVAKKLPANDEECDRCFLNNNISNLWQKGDWVICQKSNVWYHETCVGAKGKRRLIYGRCD